MRLRMTSWSLKLETARESDSASDSDSDSEGALTPFLAASCERLEELKAKMRSLKLF